MCKVCSAADHYHQASDKVKYKGIPDTTVLIINYPKGNHYHVRIQQPTNLPLKTLQEFFFIFFFLVCWRRHILMNYYSRVSHIQTFGIETFLFHKRNVTFSFWELFNECWLLVFSQLWRIRSTCGLTITIRFYESEFRSILLNKCW